MRLSNLLYWDFDRVILIANQLWRWTERRQITAPNEDRRPDDDDDNNDDDAGNDDADIVVVFVAVVVGVVVFSRSGKVETCYSGFPICHCAVLASTREVSNDSPSSKNINAFIVSIISCFQSGDSNRKPAMAMNGSTTENVTQRKPTPRRRQRRRRRF